MIHSDLPPPSHLEYSLSAPEVKSQAFALMKQLEGWCSERKAGILMDMILFARPTTVVEIGVFGGKSLIPMALALKTNGKGIIYGIDPWDRAASTQGVIEETHKKWWGEVDHIGILQGFISKIDQFGLRKQIIIIKTTSAAAAPIPDIDILHIDGNHSDEASYLDVTKWVPLVKSGGWIVFDDIGWSDNQINTNARAVNWLNEHCRKFGEYTDNCTWGIWVKP